MKKKCMKCGYERKPNDLALDYECPQCCAIYSKVETAMAKAATEANSAHNGFANYENYAACTRAKDWKGICEINGVSLDSFGTKKELRVLADYLEDDEVVFALTSGVMSQTQTSNAFDWGANTWVVVLTNERFLFLDHAMMTKSVDTQSIRHDSVQAVSASQGVMLGKIQVDLGARTVVIDNCQKATVKVVADLANKWLRVLKKRETAHVGSVTSETMQESIELARKQVENQEKIISLLEKIMGHVMITKDSR